MAEGIAAKEAKEDVQIQTELPELPTIAYCDDVHIVGEPARAITAYNRWSYLELELELIQPHMTQNPVLRGEAKRQKSVQLLERPLNAKVGVPLSIGSSRC